MPQDDLDDKDIDTSEVPELDESFFEGATLTRPGEDLLQEDFEAHPVSSLVPDLDMDEGGMEEEEPITANIPKDLFASVTASDEPASATIHIPEGGGMPTFKLNNGLTPIEPPPELASAPMPVIDINKAAEFALLEANRAAGQYGYQALVLVYDGNGSYQFRCGNLNVTTVIGFLHRVCLGLHNAAAEAISPQAQAYVGPKKSDQDN